MLRLEKVVYICLYKRVSIQWRKTQQQHETVPKTDK